MKKQSIGICKFCGQEKKLIDAHIIPKNFYLMRKKDRYLSINSKTCKYTIQQKGGYDSNILCGDCDNHILGEFDKEGYRILFSDFSKYKYEYLHPQRIYQLDNSCYDYRKYRLKKLKGWFEKDSEEFTVVCFGEHNIVCCVAPNGEKYVFDKDFLIDPDK